MLLKSKTTELESTDFNNTEVYQKISREFSDGEKKLEDLMQQWENCQTELDNYKS